MALDEEYDEVPERPVERRGFRGFWQLLMADPLDLVKLNLLFMAACLPVVTVPPALYALQYAPSSTKP